MFDQPINQMLKFFNTVSARYWDAAIGAAIFFVLAVILIMIIRRRWRDRTGRTAPGKEQAPPPAAEIKSTAEAREDRSRETGIPSAEPPETPAEPVKAPEQPPAGFFTRLKSGMTKTRRNLSGRLDAIFAGDRSLDAEMLEEIEEALITADVGVPTTMELMDRISKNSSSIHNLEDFKKRIRREMASFFESFGHIDPSEGIRPHVILMVGVNGVGKTTTIGKLAARYHAEGKKVLLAASDTFRAAAVEQLEIWAKRSEADLVMHRDKADPAAVAYDGIEAAIARNVDVVIVDTAGRLHTKVNLMEQLKKIKRSIDKKLPSAPHETLLVLDATTGQNALAQARLFHEEIGVTGIILTKLDGTAKGGIVLSICHALNIPIRYIGIGEQIEDLQKFDPKMFMDALL